MAVIGFDVFGTLVDPGGIAEAVRPHAGDRTAEVVGEWRRTQVEYAFRRAAMGRYEPFDRVTRAALDRALALHGIELDDPTREELVQAWTALPAYPEAAGALQRLGGRGHLCLAFSNGTPDGLRALLAHAGLDGTLAGILSVDRVGTFKPAMAVYNDLVSQGGAAPTDTWLVSGNPWDVIGARAAGLRAVWVQRDPGTVFDVWEERPDATVADLAELAAEPPFEG